MGAKQTDDQESYKILSLDGGGIRGVFPAAFLARIEEHLGSPIGSYFDLIAGTSTGGIIAIGLGLGLSAHDILKLYEEQRPAIFDQQHGRAENWLRQRWRGALHLFDSKYQSTPLQGSRRVAELARGPSEDPQHRYHQRREGTSAVERQTANGDIGGAALYGGTVPWCLRHGEDHHRPQS